MPDLSILEASKYYGVSRSQLYKAMESGVLSYNVLPNGRRSISPAELDRVYPSSRLKQSDRHNGTQKRQSDTPERQSELDEKFLSMERQIRTLEKTVENLENDKTYLKKLLEQATEERHIALRLLEDRRQDEMEQKKPWWKRLLS